MRQGPTQTRKRQTLASVIGAMLLCATGSNSFAQQPAPPDANYYGSPSYPGYATSPMSGESWIRSQQVQPVSYQQPPGVPPELMAPAPGMGPAAGPYYSQSPNVLTPPVAAGGNFHPHPGVDQYRYAQQQTIFQNGLWFSENRNFQRTYKGKVEYMQFYYDDLPRSRFGYDGVVPPNNQSMPREADEVLQSGGGIPDEVDLFFGNRPRSVNDFIGGNEPAPGVRVEWGWENEDGTSLMLNGWFGQEAIGIFQAGAVPTTTFDDANSADQLLFPYTLSALNPGISVNDGAGGTFVIPFDQFFEFKSYQQAYGAGFIASGTPWARGDWYSIKPLWGLRFVNLQQGFNFRGFDSGASYTYQSLSGADQQAYQDLYAFIAQVRAGVTTGGTPDSVPAGTPVDGEIITDPLDPDGTFINDNGQTLVPTSAYAASMRAETDAYLAGPELGLQLDLGSDNFGLMFKVTGGIGVNYEQMNLDGFGFYNHFISTSGQLISDSDLNNISAQSGFEQSDSSTHVSPFMDASVALHAKIFKDIPYIEDFAVMQDASLVLSAGYMVIANVTSPYESVNFVTWPINPSIETERRAWELKYFSVGLEFAY